MSKDRQLVSTTGILALAAALVGAYVYFGEVKGGERRRMARELTARLVPFPADTAVELDIQRPRERIVCRKDTSGSGHWRIESPVRAAGDDDNIDKLLKDIDKARIDRTVEITYATPETIRETGLQRPTIVTVASPQSRATFSVGNANPTDEFVYVRPDRSAPRVVLADRKLLDAAQKSLYDLRDKTALSLEPDQVTSITLRSGPKDVRLVRTPAAPAGGRAGWRVESPVRFVADRGLVERTLDLVSNVRAEQFAAESQTDAAGYGLRPPQASLRFDRRGGSDTILIGRKTTVGALTRYYACRPGAGPIFEVNDNLLNTAARTPAEWRDKHATDFEKADVAEIRLVTPQRTLVAAKTQGAQGDEWHLATYIGKVNESMSLTAAAKMPTAPKADPDRIADILSRLNTIEAVQFLDGRSPRDPAFGLAQPSLKVEALDKGGKLLASVTFGARQGTELVATSPHLGTVFLVKASETDRFRVGTAELTARS